MVEARHNDAYAWHTISLGRRLPEANHSVHLSQNGTFTLSACWCRFFDPKTKCRLSHCRHTISSMPTKSRNAACLGLNCRSSSLSTSVGRN